MSRKPSNTLNVLELMGKLQGSEIEKITALEGVILILSAMARTLFSNALERLGRLDEQIQLETRIDLNEEDF